MTDLRLAADALEKISEGFASLALAIETPSSLGTVTAVEQPAAGPTASPPVRPAPAGTTTYTSLPPSFDELPPDDGLLEVAIRTTGGTEIVTTDVGLGYCPTHKTPWTVKPAGTSKAGKQYNAFWKCDDRSDGFCNEKPSRAWGNSHPIREGAAA